MRKKLRVAISKEQRTRFVSGIRHNLRGQGIRPPAIHFLHLNPMRRPSFSLVGKWILAGAVCIGFSLIQHTAHQDREAMAFSEQRESQQSSGPLDPNEWFALDRNYPDDRVNLNTYRKLLDQSMRYDRTVPHAHRNLDTPWTLEGPGNIGGRVNAVAVHPVNPDIMFLGYSQGGIYRTEDGGETWVPVFDEHPSLSIGHIAFDPQDPSRMWAATGDVNISGYYWIGAGVYESKDTGRTWHYKGLSQAGVLSKVIVDRTNPNIIYVGSMGIPAQKGNDKGIYRSVNGGNTWQKVFTVDDSTGIIDMVIDPTQPGRLFASAWTRIRSNTQGVTVGPGTGLYRSEDYGSTWINIRNGLPEGEHSRTGVEITNDGTLFMSYVGNIDFGDCEGVTEDLRDIFVSDDAGQTWNPIPFTTEFGLLCGVLGGFGWYFETLKVNPDNPLDMAILGVSMYRTFDGGVTWFESTGNFPVNVHADKHDLVFAHGRMYLGTDGGAYETDINQFEDWRDIENIPSTQYYRTTWNPHLPDWYFGGAQDNGTSGGNGDFFNEWQHFFGGDGFQPLFDPDEPDWMFATTQNGNVWFSQDGGFDFNWFGLGLDGTRYWDMPLVMSPHNPKILYCGSYQVYQINMQDTEWFWIPISLDLTRGESILGGRYPAITAIAVSPLDPNRLYAGTQDGLLWTTNDGGMNWSEITEGTPGFFVTSITCSTIEPEGVIVTYSGYRDNDHQPYIFRSHTAGDTWTPIMSDLPLMGVNNLFILPGSNDEILLVGTDAGVYVTFDGGAKWERVGNNMPYMPVYDIDYNPVLDKIIAATFSRGIMSFPVEELEETTAAQSAGQLTQQAIHIYPTVIRDHFYYEMATDPFSAASTQLRLLDVRGTPLETFEMSGRAKGRVSLAGHYPAGVYFFEWRHDHFRAIQKVLIQP